jgi:hypothetical protein
MSERKPLSPAEWSLVVLAALVLAGGLAWFFWPKAGPPPALAPPPAAPVAAPAGPAAPPAPADAPPPAPLTEEELRARLLAASAHPLWPRALEGGDLLSRCARLVENLAAGVVPRKLLAPLAPSGRFEVQEREGRTFVAGTSYGRHDRAAGLVSSLDAKALAGLYRAVHPALEAAYRALGYPPGGLDKATARALARLEAAPVRVGALEVVSDGEGTWMYADDRLEALGEVEKQLLRMGPFNTRKVQAKARELREALGLPAAR